MIGAISSSPNSASMPTHKTIKGKWNDKITYRIRLNLEDPIASKAKLIEEQKKYRLTFREIRWDHLNYSAKSIRQLAISDPSQFSVRIESSESAPGYVVHLSCSKKTEELRVATKPTKPTLLTSRNGLDLAEAVKANDDPLVRKVLDRMAWNGAQTAGDTVTNYEKNEIIELVEFLRPEQVLQLIEKFIQDVFQRDVVSEYNISTSNLIFLNRILSKLQTLFEQSTLKYAAEFPEEIPLRRPPQLSVKPIALNELRKLIHNLSEKLEKNKTSPENIAQYLRTQLAIYHFIMSEAGANDFGQFEAKLLKELSRYRSHHDIRLAYLSEYAAQSFKKISYIENRIVTNRSRGLLTFQAIAKSFTQICSENIWTVLNSIHSNRMFNSLFKNLDDGFVQLTLLRLIFLEKDPNKVIEFENGIPSNGKHFLHRPFFVQGLIELLKEVVLKEGQNNSEALKSSIRLLKKIANENQNSKYIENSVFRLNNFDHCERVVLQISIFLYEITNRKPLVLDEGHFTLFSRQLKHVAPWASGLRSLQKKLEEDPIIQKFKALDQNSLIATHYNHAIDSRIIPALQKESNKKINTVIVNEPVDSIKSLFAKYFVLKNLETYNSQKPLALYVSLPSLKNPYRELVEETLEKYDLERFSFFDKHKEIYLICDGLEELWTRNKEEERRVGNLFMSNHLESLHRNVKLIYICKQGFLKFPDDGVNFMSEYGICALVDI